ncbi:MAG TPA: DUF1254 domain-containing protein [Mycobacteriales bacterium]|nr:DUF1254 domain-containing protein [Mycobacteriales bacterium]
MATATPAVAALADGRANMYDVGLDSAQISATAAEACVFGYPLVLMKLTRDQMTAVPGPDGIRAPVNQFGHLRKYPDASVDTVVGPNTDTLYSSAWLDLSDGPMVLSVPDTDGRYYLMPMLDGWTNVFSSPGARTTGTGPEQFGIVGPHWRDRLPDTMRRIRSPTNMAWIIGRVQANGPADYQAAHAVQDGMRLTPLSALGRRERTPGPVRVDPEVDPRTPPSDQMSRLDPAAFFGMLTALLAGNPARAADQPMIDRLAGIGVRPGESFDWSGLDEPTRQAVELGLRQGMATVLAEGRTPRGELRNGWTMSYDLGEYGTYYARRAGVAWVGLGANHAEDAVYALSRADADKQPYTGGHRYLLRFDSGAVPPVRAFWSLAMYDDRQRFVPNPVSRYAIGSRDDLTVNTDGSLDIHIQQAPPGRGRESNWLPAPAGGFTLVLRMYWPERTVLSRAWVPPAVRRAR